MITDVRNLHLPGSRWISSFQAHNSSALNNCMGYHPGISSIQESTSSLVFRVPLHNVSEDFSVGFLNLLRWLHEQTRCPTFLRPRSKVVLYV